MDYSYVHGKTPGGDGLNLNGGDVSLALPVSGPVLMVGEFGLTRATNIAGTGLNLTIATLMAGPRFSISPRGKLQPSFQLLLGVAQARGSAFSTIGNTTGFAVAPGVRFDTPVSPRISLRLIEVDYRFSTYRQNSNDRESSLRLGAGVVLYF